MEREKERGYREIEMTEREMTEIQREREEEDGLERGGGSDG